MKTTELRENIYNVLDRIIETGKPVEIERKGAKLKIVPEKDVSPLERLKNKKKKKAYKGDSDELIHMDWSKEWDPKHI
ncbi:MAG: type II toxin-antitoxin system Phd/YefM family antitoxin [Planctomycetota bacterium]